MFGTALAPNAKCAKCQAALGPTGTFTVLGSDWYHSWCAPAVARGKGTHPLYDEIAAVQKLYGDKSEQYVAERLAHERLKGDLRYILAQCEASLTGENDARYHLGNIHAAAKTALTR